MAARPLGMPGEDDAEGDGESLSRGSSVIRLDPPTDRGIVNPRPCNGWQVKHRGGISGSSDSPLAAQQGLDSLVRVLKRNNPRSSHLWTHRCGYGGPCRHMASHDDAGNATSDRPVTHRWQHLPQYAVHRQTLTSIIRPCIAQNKVRMPSDHRSAHLGNLCIRPCVVRFCLYPW